MTYDVIIVGAGPAGISCGIEASKAGLHYAIIEKGVLVNSIFHFPVNMTFFSTSNNLEIAQIPFISHSDKPTRHEALEYYRRVVEAYNLEIKYREELREVTTKDDGAFFIETITEKYHSKNIILATGFYDQPNLMNIDGEELPKVKHYYDEGHHYIQQNVLIVGAGNSACDVALECWQKGANVTMAIQADQLDRNIKYWILPNIENRIVEGSIKAYYNAHVLKITDKMVEISVEGNRIQLPNDFVLAMTGYKPNYELLNKLNIQIGLDEYKTPIVDQNTNMSSINGIYLAGVLLGGLKTNKYHIENTRNHAAKIMRDIVLKSSIT